MADLNLAAFLQTIWAMTPAGLEMLPKLFAAAKPEAAAAPQRQRAAPGASVGVLDLSGPIMQKSTWWGTSTEEFGQALDAMVADPSVKSVLINVDSPGGSVSGVQELASKIYAARGTKPIVAISNSQAASAAYWIATAADRLYITPGGEAGSIGVFAIHADMSQALENEGIKVSVIKAGEYKAEWIPYLPLTPEARDYEQQQVDRIHGEFIAAVSRHRGVSESVVRKSFGQGRTVDAKAAVAAGMADRVATFEQVVERLQSGRIKAGSVASASEWSSNPMAETLRRRMAMERR